MITHSNLHYTIIKYIIDNGYAPNTETLATLLKTDNESVEKGLYALQEYHGVVLHPHQPIVWVLHPFALAPTNFLVKAGEQCWWGNCAWCSLGIAALLKKDVTITTRLAGYDEQVVIHIVNGEIQEKNLYVHLSVPLKKAWDNVMYTCSTILVFKDEAQVDDWTNKHNIPKGDIQPITTIWELSKKWYGNHLSPQWEKWTVEEARNIFLEFNLTHPTWELEASKERF